MQIFDFPLRLISLEVHPCTHFARTYKFLLLKIAEVFYCLFIKFQLVCVIKTQVRRENLQWKLLKIHQITKNLSRNPIKKKKKRKKKIVFVSSIEDSSRIKPKYDKLSIIITTNILTYAELINYWSFYVMLIMI